MNVLNQIVEVTARKTYFGNSETELVAPGYHLEAGDCDRRWNIVKTSTGKRVALLVCTDRRNT